MGALRRRAGLVILCCLAVAGSALAFSLLQEKQYTATATLLIRDLGLGGGFSSDASREAATNVQLGSAPEVATETADDLDQRVTPDEIVVKVAIQDEPQANILRVVATDPDPQLASDLANTFARRYVEFKNEADRAEVRDALRRVQGEYEALSPEERNSEVGRPIQREIGSLTAQEAAQTANLQPIQEATVPSAPSSPKVARNTAFGALLGLMVGVGVALLLERRDRRIREPVELAGLLGLPLLGSIPQSEAIRFPARDAQETLPYGEAEAFRAIWRRFRSRTASWTPPRCAWCCTMPSSPRACWPRRAGACGRGAGSSWST
jgi:capsular polysaccharide biosynthesis protein